MDVNEFKGKNFRKQLGYYNRTFLIGYYEYIGGKCTYQVIQNGKVFDFDDFEEAVKKFNEIALAGDRT